MSNLVDTRLFLLDQLSIISLQKPTGTNPKIPYYSTPTYKRMEQHLIRIIGNSSYTDLMKVRTNLTKQKGEVPKQSLKLFDDLTSGKKPKSKPKSKPKTKGKKSK
jgi:hypothetical protein